MGSPLRIKVEGNDVQVFEGHASSGFESGVPERKRERQEYFYAQAANFRTGDRIALTAEFSGVFASVLLDFKSLTKTHITLANVHTKKEFRITLGGTRREHGYDLVCLSLNSTPQSRRFTDEDIVRGAMNQFRRTEEEEEKVELSNAERRRLPLNPVTYTIGGALMFGPRTNRIIFEQGSAMEVVIVCESSLEHGKDMKFLNIRGELVSITPKGIYLRNVESKARNQRGPAEPSSTYIHAVPEQEGVFLLPFDDIHGYTRAMILGDNSVTFSNIMGAVGLNMNAEAQHDIATEIAQFKTSFH